MTWLARLSHVALVCIASIGAGCAGDEDRSAPSVAPRPSEISAVSERALLSRMREATHTLQPGSLSRSMQGLSRSKGHDGIIKVHLGGRFQHAQVVVVDEEGQPRAACVDGLETDPAALALPDANGRAQDAP